MDDCKALQELKSSGARTIEKVHAEGDQLASSSAELASRSQ